MHIAPRDLSKTGVVAHATVIDELFAKYLPGRVNWVRADGDDALRVMESVPSNVIVFAEIGSNEGRVFQALNSINRIRPNLPRIIIVHDPPYLEISYFPFFVWLGRFLAGRAARRVFARVVGKALDKRFILPTDIFVCLTTEGVELFRAKLRNLDVAAQVCHVPHPSYIDPILPNTTRSPCRTSHSPRVGYFGHVSQGKGIHVLVDAALQLAASEGKEAIPIIEIRGRAANSQASTYIERLRTRVHQANLSDKIQFGDFVPQEDLTNFLSGLDAVVLPYLEDRASFSGPVLWARCLGIPVVANNTKGTRALLKHGLDGLLIPLDRQEIWKKVLKQITTFDPEWRTVSENSSAAYAEGNWEVIAERYWELIERCAGIASRTQALSAKLR